MKRPCDIRWGTGPSHVCGCVCVYLLLYRVHFSSWSVYRLKWQVTALSGLVHADGVDRWFIKWAEPPPGAVRLPGGGEADKRQELGRAR